LTTGRKPTARELSARELEAAWASLAADPAEAYRAVSVLAAAPRQAVPFLSEHLKPVAPESTEKIRRLIADLDSSRFAVRQTAGAELERMGEDALPLLKRALIAGPSLETRRRLEDLIVRLPWRAATGEELRGLRAIEAMEGMATPEALALLKRLAKGAPGAGL